MHYIVKQGLLSSIQTIKSVLSGMEILINASPSEGQTNKVQTYQPVATTNENGITEEDELRAAKALGLQFEVTNDA